MTREHSTVREHSLQALGPTWPLSTPVVSIVAVSSDVITAQHRVCSCSCGVCCVSCDLCCVLCVVRLTGPSLRLLAQTRFVVPGPRTSGHRPNTCSVWRWRRWRRREGRDGSGAREHRVVCTRRQWQGFGCGGGAGGAYGGDEGRGRG